MVKKSVFVLVVATFALWTFFAVLIPGLEVVSYPHGRFVSGTEEFFMTDGLRGGTLAVRNYWHIKFPDGFEREYGSISYGLGKKHKHIIVEAVKETGKKPQIIQVFVNDGHLSAAGSLWRATDDPMVDSGLLKEDDKSLDMGRRRLADWRKNVAARTSD